MHKLSPDLQRSYMSDYLQHSWKQEKMDFSSVMVEPGKIIGLLDVHEYTIGGDGDFHLSAQAAMAWMSQLAIIYGCWDNKLPQKIGEVYLRNMQLRFFRPVRKTRNILISAEIPPNGRRVLPDKSVYYREMLFSVEDGCFYGTGSFILPTVPEQPKNTHHTSSLANITSDFH